MKINKILLITTMLLAFITLSGREAQAFDKTARPSAQLALREQKPKEDPRVKILTKYLEKYNSPLVPSAGKFIEEADKNNLDWKLVVSIAGVESYFGKQIPYNSYNCWGYGVYGSNVRYFTSWDDAITTVSTDLRTKYMDKWGATDVYEIGSFYAVDPQWANKVTHFENELDTFYQNENKPVLLSISL